MSEPDAVFNEWFPVAHSDDIEAGSCHAFDLLDKRYLLLCDNDGQVSVALDSCPHRGAQLSLGSFDGMHVVCGYHGWEFEPGGMCTTWPAHPDQKPPVSACLDMLTVQLRYDMWWVCVGSEPRNMPSFPEHAEQGAVTVAVGPITVRSSGPRIIENFLDMAHFPFVHPGELGLVPHTEVRSYDVSVVDDELRFDNCVFWQPNPAPDGGPGGDVEYSYSISHPYAARLAKVPPGDPGAARDFAVLLMASPVSEFECRVWKLTTVASMDVDEDTFRQHSHEIFMQDVEIVESQQPQRLPIDPRAEAHQRADAGSLAYRRWLLDRGVRYGTSLMEEPDG